MSLIKTNYTDNTQRQALQQAEDEWRRANAAGDENGMRRAAGAAAAAKNAAYQPAEGNMQVSQYGVVQTPSGGLIYSETGRQVDPGPWGKPPAPYERKVYMPAAKAAETPAQTAPPQEEPQGTYQALAEAYAAAMQKAGADYSQAQDVAYAYAAQRASQQRAAAQQRLQTANREAQLDYQRAVDPYGYNAEALAMQGLSRSGYAESSLVSYGSALLSALAQNRVSYNEALAQIDDTLAQARLSGDSKKAEAAYELRLKVTEKAAELGVKQAEADRKQEQENYERELTERKFAIAREQEDYERELTERKLAIAREQEEYERDLNERKLRLQQEKQEYEQRLKQDKQRSDAAQKAFSQQMQQEKLRLEQEEQQLKYEQQYNELQIQQQKLELEKLKLQYDFDYKTGKWD